MKPLPLPVRVAAGLAVIAVDRARHLPEKLTELPVTMVSQALQLSMRLQQQVTELAIKGDDALATFRPVEESPDWATFDEDTTGEQYDISPAGRSTTNGARSRFDDVRDADPDTDTDSGTDTEADLDAAADSVARADTDAEADMEADEGGGPAAAEDPWAAEERAMLSELGSGPDDEPSPAQGGDDLPGSVPHYPDLTLPQLRARLRRLDTGQLAELLGYETTHAERPEFVGMLTRRIATLRDQQ